MNTLHGTKSLLFFLLLFLHQVTDCSAHHKVRIHGSVTFTAIYKGGARPTPEILDQCCSPKPYSNKIIYLKKNYYSPALYKIKTDANGNFKKCLRTGSYSVYINNEVDAEKAASLTNENASVTDPFFVFEVSRSGSKEIKIELKARMGNEVPRP